MNFVSLTRKLLIGAGLLALCSAGAAERQPQLDYYKDRGSVVVHNAFPNPAWGAGFKLQQYNGKYKPMKDFVFDGSEQEGRLTTADGERIPVKILCTKKSPTELQAKLSVQSAQPFSCGRLMYEQSIRYEPGVGIKVTVNGETFDYSKPFDPKKPYQKVIPVPAGETAAVVVDAPNASWTITGKFAVILQDLRKWKADVLQLRLMFTPYSGMITESSLEFSLVLNPKQ